MNTGHLKEDIIRSGYSLRETHISWVFLNETRAYKIKKPLSLGFLDFTTLESRLTACKSELELNSRLAPDIYLGLVPITWSADTGHEIDGGGKVVDWAVAMVRLQDSDSAEAMIRRGVLERSHIQILAQALADFHQNCVTDTKKQEYGSLESIFFNVEENFHQTQKSGPKHLDIQELKTISDFQRQFLQQQSNLFARRLQEGYIRDGHGDLRLEHVYFQKDTLQIIDCIEFNDRFRYADVCSDIAFLCMDLVFHERSDLSEFLLAGYADKTFDYGLYQLIDFYMSYRAYTRAKVTAILEEQEDLEEELRANLHRQARKYFLLAEASCTPPLQPPLLIVVFGIIASGKSSLAASLAETIGAPVLSSDKTRKHFAGVSPATSLASAPFHGAYTEETTSEVYETLYNQADIVLRSLRPVIIDATCSKASQRTAFRQLARTHGVKLFMVECTIAEDLCRQRLEERAKKPSISDATLDIFELFMARYETPEELPRDILLRLDTSSRPTVLRQKVLNHLKMQTLSAATG